jgi:phage shock protein A
MTKQTILGRVSQLTRANPDALLDQAEDPQKMIDQLIRDHVDTIREGEDAVAAALRELRLLKQDHAEDVAAAAEWGGGAAAASRRADALRGARGAAAADTLDDLARIALDRQLQAEREAAAAEPAIAAQSELVDRLRTGLDRAKIRLTHLRDRRDELVARSRIAPSRGTRADAIRSVNVLDPTDDLSRFEDKVRREEARARGTEELAPSSLDAQFVALDSPADSAEIDARLARLKSAPGV